MSKKRKPTYQEIIKLCNKKDKEIERLNKENEELKKIQCNFLGTGCKQEIERLHSIIKEVREYIENPNNEMSVKSYQELLEILDKENKEWEI